MRQRLLPSRTKQKPSAGRAIPRARRISVPPRARSDTTPRLRTAFGAAAFQPDPYLDYGRFLTAEGGVLFIYKDLDLRLRYVLWRVLAWISATALEGCYLRDHSPVQNAWVNLVCFLGVAVLNFLIVRKPIEVFRRAEIRPDSMILDDSDVFWLRLMENGLPSFQADKDGNQVLCGIYGTRFIEYLTARRFDDYDRMPEVFAAHLQQAMGQLWATAIMRGSARSTSRTW